jgi:hypothetical protein
MLCIPKATAASGGQKKHIACPSQASEKYFPDSLARGLVTILPEYQGRELAYYLAVRLLSVLTAEKTGV